MSTKALRLYDRLGLLTPDHVDHPSGYRWYRESQLATARLVVQLRRLDMPLAQIEQVVSAPGLLAAELIESYWETVERLRRSSAYDAVEQWINLQGLTDAGSAREVYFADFDPAGPVDEVCDVACPIR